MKKTLTVICVFVITLWFSALKAQTVYVTESGKKYHAKNCSLAKTGKKGMELAAAKKEGYEPCKNCKADEIKLPAAQPKDKKEKIKAPSG
jgi:methylphosphotriester-DNA--protein-cysteine methyltransferase